MHMTRHGSSSFAGGVVYHRNGDAFTRGAAGGEEGPFPAYVAGSLHGTAPPSAQPGTAGADAAVPPPSQAHPPPLYPPTPFTGAAAQPPPAPQLPHPPPAPAAPCACAPPPAPSNTPVHPGVAGMLGLLLGAMLVMLPLVIVLVTRRAPPTHASRPTWDTAAAPQASPHKAPPLPPAVDALYANIARNLREGGGRP